MAVADVMGAAYPGARTCWIGRALVSKPRSVAVRSS